MSLKDRQPELMQSIQYTPHLLQCAKSYKFSAVERKKLVQVDSVNYSNDQLD